jgi:hypothetical protein
LVLSLFLVCITTAPRGRGLLQQVIDGLIFSYTYVVLLFYQEFFHAADPSQLGALDALARIWESRIAKWRRSTFILSRNTDSY